MDDRPLCLLALDGGGIRGLSELVVLEEIMNRIKHDLDSDEDLLPADFFDLIGGTSTGGLIALLLGRLHRSVPQAKREYIRIAEEVFSMKRYLKQSTFDAQKLEVAVKRLLGDSRSEEKMVEKNGRCKVFVCAVPQQDVRARAGPRLFRTYNVRENASFNCTIWEACRATSAAPSYFEPINIGDEGEQETFVDGGLGYNNPVEQVLEEAKRVFPGRKVACVVSIGTGVASVIKFPNAPKTSPIRLITALSEMATESDTMAEKMQNRFQNARDVYFRFSVDRGLEGIGLEEWKELSKVRTFTTGYLHQHNVSGHINKVVEALLASKIVHRDSSSALVRLSTVTSANNDTQRAPDRALEWRQASIPKHTFSYTTEQLASHIVSNRDPIIKSHFLVPFGRNQEFVGRTKILSQLQERIWPGTNQEDCQRTAIEGLGGVGKTQIALEAVYRFRDKHPDCSIFWVPAVDANTFENAYRDIGKQMKIAGIDEDKADVKQLIKAALSDENSGSWLLVVDNADDMELLFRTTCLSDYLPFSQKGSILFTTRNHEVAVELDIPDSDITVVGEMDASEALDLLRKGLKESQTSSAEGTERLLNILANLPLAIRQASAYIAKKRMSTSEYLKLCESERKDMIDLLSKDFGDRYRYKNIQNPVATTWLISFRQISQHDPLAAEYLKFMSLLAEKDIPKSLLPTAREIKALEAIGTLKAYAFITQREGQDSFDMHRLVRLAMQNWLENEGLKSCVSSVIQQLDQAFPFPKHENRDIWMKYLPHAQAALEFREHLEGGRVDAGLLYNVAESYRLQGHYQRAEQMYWQSLQLCEKVLGKEHPSTLDSINNLAIVLSNLGKYEVAEQKFRQLLKLHENVLGKEHPSTLDSMGNLANVLSNLGKYDEAEQMHRQTLQLRENVLGKEHPDTLSSMNNLALVLSNLGKYDEAEQMHRQTLQLREKVLGKEHPSTLDSINNLAIVLSNLGKYEVAEQKFRQLLKLYENVLGKEHPSTLDSMNNLALVLSNLAKYEAAEQMHRQTLQLREKVQGKDHPSNDLEPSFCLKKMGDRGGGRYPRQRNLVAG